MIPEIRDERQMRALRGVPAEKFLILESAFALALADEKERAYQAGLATGKRQRKPGGGQRGKLPTIQQFPFWKFLDMKFPPTDKKGLESSKFSHFSRNFASFKK